MWWIVCACCCQVLVIHFMTCCVRDVRLMACFVTQSRTDCGPEKMTTEERSAISARLTHILTAYAYNDPVVGYCQGKLQSTIITSLAFHAHPTVGRKGIPHKDIGVRLQSASKTFCLCLGSAHQPCTCCQFQQSLGWSISTRHAQLCFLKLCHEQHSQVDLLSMVPLMSATHSTGGEMVMMSSRQHAGMPLVAVLVASR